MHLPNKLSIEWRSLMLGALWPVLSPGGVYSVVL